MRATHPFEAIVTIGLEGAGCTLAGEAEKSEEARKIRKAKRELPGELIRASGS